MFRIPLLALAALGLHGPASAASCQQGIATAERYLAAHPDQSGDLKQTKDAQLMHQPTQAAVAKAKMESRDHLSALLAEAKAEHAAGDERGCGKTLAEIDRMLKL